MISRYTKFKLRVFSVIFIVIFYWITLFVSFFFGSLLLLSIVFFSYPLLNVVLYKLISSVNYLTVSLSPGFMIATLYCFFLLDGFPSSSNILLFALVALVFIVIPIVFSIYKRKAIYTAFYKDAKLANRLL